MSINGDLADSEYGDDYIEQEECLSDTTSEKFDAKADKRAHHNALERKRRDHIKDSFSSLKNAVPTFNGEKASRAQILKKAAEYISIMRSKNNDHQRDIDSLKKENKILEEKIRALEQMKNGTNYNNNLDLPVNIEVKQEYINFDGITDTDISLNNDNLNTNSNNLNNSNSSINASVHRGRKGTATSYSSSNISPNKRRKTTD